MADKKFKCTLYGECEHADQDKIILESEVEPEGGEYYCTCGQHNKLVEIEKKSFPIKNVLMITGVIVIAALILWGSMNFFTGNEKDGVTDAVAVQQQNNTPSSNGSAVETDVSQTTVNQISSDLSKIGNNTNYSLAQRDQLIEPTLEKYFSDPAFVKRVGSNGTIVETLTAEEYLARLAGVISLDRVEIIKTLTDESNGKFRELVVQEHYTTSIN